MPNGIMIFPKLNLAISSDALANTFNGIKRRINSNIPELKNFR
jgi:hypothetical protein